MDNYIQELDDCVMSGNNVEHTVPTNTVTIIVYVLNDPVPACIIEQILHDMNCMH